MRRHRLVIDPAKPEQCEKSTPPTHEIIREIHRQIICDTTNATRRGLSIARYLVELVERDASEEDAGLRHECPELTLAAEEQRELLEAVREVRALMLEGEDAGPLVRDMQERIAVMFAAWASAMAGSGRSEELRAALARVLGEERARIAMASVVPSAASG